MFGFFKKLSRDPVNELIDKMCEGCGDNRSSCIGYFRTISYDLNDSYTTQEWIDVISTIGTILVDGVGLLADHFLIWKDGNPIYKVNGEHLSNVLSLKWRCVISDEALLTGPLFDIKDGTYYFPFSTVEGGTLSKSLAEQLRCYGFQFNLCDSRDINNVAEVAAKAVNKIKRANHLLADSALIVREYCYVDFNTDRVLFQKVTPERVDAICDAIVASNGGVKPEFIDEYRQYIIQALAAKSKSNPAYAHMKIEYDWPEAIVSVYPDFADEHMESIRAKRAEEERRKGRAAMNRKYKKVIDEISHCLIDVR